jgi:hypothetical protein
MQNAGRRRCNDAHGGRCGGRDRKVGQAAKTALAHPPRIPQRWSVMTIAKIITL